MKNKSPEMQAQAVCARQSAVFEHNPAPAEAEQVSSGSSKFTARGVKHYVALELCIFLSGYISQ